MGGYAANTLASILMFGSNNQHSDDVIRLAGAELVTVAEPELCQRFTKVKIKSFTGSDMMITRPLATCARQRGVLLKLC